MFDSVRYRMLAFSRLLQNRRKYVSHLSAVGISVDIFSGEQKVVSAAVGYDAPILIDLDTSKWMLSDWLERLIAEGISTQAVFFTEVKQSEMIEHFDNSEDTTAARVDFFCASEEALSRRSSKEFLRILDLFNSVV